MASSADDNTIAVRSCANSFNNSTNNNTNNSGRCNDYLFKDLNNPKIDSNTIHQSIENFTENRSAN